MFSLNKAQIIGNLTRDPELRMIPSGQSVTSFAVATNRRWKDKNGEMQEDAQFHEIVAWGKLAEIAQKILSKGKKAYVEGRLQTRSWEAQDGSKRQKTEIVAENIIALSAKEPAEAELEESLEADLTPKENPAKAQEKKEEKHEKVAEKKSTKEETEEELDLEDIPF